MSYTIIFDKKINPLAHGYFTWHRSAFSIVATELFDFLYAVLQIVSQVQKITTIFHQLNFSLDLFIFGLEDGNLSLGNGALSSDCVVWKRFGFRPRYEAGLLIFH